MSEYIEHNEHLIDEIQRLREANYHLRKGAEEAKQRIKQLEEAGNAMWATAGIGFTTEDKL